MPRPKTERVLVAMRLRANVAAELDRRAAAAGASRTAYVEALVMAGLAQDRAGEAYLRDTLRPTATEAPIIPGQTEPVIAGAGGPGKRFTGPIPKAKDR